MPSSLLPPRSLNSARFTPKMSQLSPANCFISLCVNAREGQWKESYDSGDVDFHFRKISNSSRLAPVPFLNALLLFLQPNLSSSSRRLRASPKHRQKRWMFARGRGPVAGQTVTNMSGLYCILANTTRASHNPVRNSHFHAICWSPGSQHCCPLAACVREAGGCWWGLEGFPGGCSCPHPPNAVFCILSDSKTAELAKRRPVAAGEVHQWEPGHVALSGLRPRNGRWAQGILQPLLSQLWASCLGATLAQS